MHDDEGEEGEKKRAESFVVGKDVEAGERVVWIVEGGKYKASFLEAEDGVDEWESRLLISEVSHFGAVAWASGGIKMALLFVRRYEMLMCCADGCTGFRICGSRLLDRGDIREDLNARASGRAEMAGSKSLMTAFVIIEIRNLALVR